jgi:hypothetical protein
MVIFRPAVGAACALCLLSCAALGQDEYTGLRPAETRPDSLSRFNTASIFFDKMINTYHWNGLASYQNALGPFSVKMADRFLSTLIQTDRKLITDEHSLDLSLQRRLWSPLSAGMKVSFFSLSNNKDIGISDAATQSLYGGLSYQPVNRFTIEPYIGVRYDHQLDQHDHGPSYLLDLAGDGLDYNGYKTFLTGKWEYDQLSPRTLETRNALLNIEKIFFEQTQNTLQFIYTRNRRDFYFAADSVVQRQFGVLQNIETRTEDALSVYDSLAYGVSKRMSLSFQGNLYTRTIGREDRYRSAAGTTPNTDINELRLESAVRLDYTPWDAFRGFAQFSYQERDETHSVEGEPLTPGGNPGPAARTEERKNNHSRRSSLSSSLTLGLPPADTITLSGSGSLLRYDTPSALNDDDRDELWYIASFVWSHRLNRHFTFWVQANANLNHLVYIFSSRSADNTWNRVIRLAPRLAYSPAAEFTTTNTFEVLANYTVYDFESPSSPIRSFAFRQFSFTDSSGFDLTNRLRIEWFSGIRLYEQGELRWADFSEQPLTSFEDHTYLGTVRYRFSRSLLFSTGIRYFSQRRYVFNGQERVLDRYLRSIGPVTAIVWNVGERTEFATNGWFENQTQTGSAGRSFANITMSLTVHM